MTDLNNSSALVNGIDNEGNNVNNSDSAGSSANKSNTTSGGLKTRSEALKYPNGTYDNPWPTWRVPSIPTFFKYMFNHSATNAVDNSTMDHLDAMLPIFRPDFTIAEKNPDKICLTWLGHASCLFQMEGYAVLADPIFSDVCFFAGWITAKVSSRLKRYRKPPCTVDDLPDNLCAVVISHNHYDHLDLETVRQLNARYGKKLQWYVPLGLRSWFHSTGIRFCYELDWWQKANIPDTPISVTCLPAQHWSLRGLFDRNKTLWCSWGIHCPSSTPGSSEDSKPMKNMFFAGDTGYCTTFKEIGDYFNEMGGCDMAAIPIGAFHPRYLLAPQHVDPQHALLIHKDVGAKKSVGIHWGTFPLGFEDVMDPANELRAAVSEDFEKTGVRQYFDSIQHGETAML